MECPSCGVEMVELTGDDQTIRKCSDCGGLWVDVSDLNRMLLHHNLPGLESIGGKVDPDAMSGQCSECQVDLIRIVGGEKTAPMSYDTCESCGGVFVESDAPDVSDYAGAKNKILDFFARFSPNKKKKPAVVHG